MIPKILAMYLPQYHQIPENDEYWGEGFTDWVTVKNAKPLFGGHEQPRVPLNNFYYDLSKEEDIVWQAKLAKEYGIYGFGIYHYWFNNDKNLLTKPAHIIMNNEEIDINYFYAWDNISWKRSWSNVKEKGNVWAPAFESDNKIVNGPSILIPYILGEEKDWENHYKYLSPFFKDSRYIKINNKPLFLIYHKDDGIDSMCDYWNRLAIKDGFEGVKFMFRYDRSITPSSRECYFKYEPQYSGFSSKTICDRIIAKAKRILFPKKQLKIYDYDDLWKKIIKNAKNMSSVNIYHGCFVNYDDTPRRGERGGICVKNSTPDQFKRFLQELVDISAEQNKEFVFLTAWNEWGEGAYLEPDSINKYEYLEALKEIVQK